MIIYSLACAEPLGVIEQLKEWWVEIFTWVGRMSSSGCGIVSLARVLHGVGWTVLIFRKQLQRRC